MVSIALVPSPVNAKSELRVRVEYHAKPIRGRVEQDAISSIYQLDFGSF